MGAGEPHLEAQKIKIAAAPPPQNAPQLRNTATLH
jgi:hypothetical protein